MPHHRARIPVAPTLATPITAVGAAVVVVVAVAVVLLARGPGEHRRTSVLPRIYFGAFVPGAEDDLARLAAFERDAHRPVAIVHWYVGWAYGGFPTAQMNAVRRRGSIPMISWLSSNLTDPEINAVQDIIQGRLDAYIARWALASKAWGHPYFLRLDWEMNINIAYPPADYVRMWQHVHDVFTRMGATNATWVWCPNVEHPGSIPLQELYPGAGYVDWTCMDGYNWGTSQQWSSWTDFSSLFSQTYDHLVALAPNKPIMIGEVASAEQGGSKARWIAGALTTLPRRFPMIRALIWFNDYHPGNPDDWRIESSAAAQSAFVRAITSPLFLSNTFGDLVSSPIPAPGPPIVARLVPQPSPATRPIPSQPGSTLPQGTPAPTVLPSTP